MNTLLRTTAAVAALCLSGTAVADVICDNCVELTNFLPYVGAYWPGDRGTFSLLTPLTPPGLPFDRSYVLDLNDTSTLALSIRGTELTNLRAELYEGSPSICGPEPGDTCSQHVFNELLECTHLIAGECIQIINPYPTLTGTDKKRISITRQLAPGRYVLRVILRKATLEGSYAVTVAVRKATP
jgi:hypothetical protein